MQHAKPKRGFVLLKKSESPVHRFVGKIVKPFNKKYMDRYWTCNYLPWPFKARMYTPTRYDEDPNWGTPEWREDHKDTIDHEKVHIAQGERYTFLGQAVMGVGPSPFLFGLALLSLFLCSNVVTMAIVIAAVVLLPLSIGLAWGRARLELEAYLVQVSRWDDVPKTVQWVADNLWDNYGYAWPKAWTKAWYARRGFK